MTLQAIYDDREVDTSLAGVCEAYCGAKVTAGATTCPACNHAMPKL